MKQFLLFQVGLDLGLVAVAADGEHLSVGSLDALDDDLGVLDASEVGEVTAEKNQIDLTQIGQLELGLTGPVKIDEAEDLEGAGLGFFAGHGRKPI